MVIFQRWKELFYQNLSGDLKPSNCIINMHLLVCRALSGWTLFNHLRCSTVFNEHSVVIIISASDKAWKNSSPIKKSMKIFMVSLTPCCARMMSMTKRFPLIGIDKVSQSTYSKHNEQQNDREFRKRVTFMLVICRSALMITIKWPVECWNWSTIELSLSVFVYVQPTRAQTFRAKK